MKGLGRAVVVSQQKVREEPGRTDCKNKNKTAVLLATGFLDDSTAFVLDFPDQCVGFFLADNCYDVWIGNFRGSTLYGKRAINASLQESPDFWAFSFHQFGVYDLPALIDHVLVQTYQQQLLYVGMFQAAFNFLVMMSERPEYNDKVKAALFLTPLYRAQHVRFPFPKLLFTVAEGITAAMYNANNREAFPKNTPLSMMASQACEHGDDFLCAWAADVALNLESEHLNKSRISVYLCQIPTGTSVLNLVHAYQVSVRNSFQTLDCTLIADKPEFCGPVRKYKIKNTKVSVGIIHSTGDTLVPPEDVMILVSDLGDVVKFRHQINDSNFGQLNFRTAAFIMKKYVLKPMLSFFRQYGK
ncbi:lipase 3-like [Ornithodoros turicata]|uniref:lipase 3-like n=1 Tax=Ornithodoros turicata TaxID=34597 RepID=UPI0031388AD9